MNSKVLAQVIREKGLWEAVDDLHYDELLLAQQIILSALDEVSGGSTPQLTSEERRDVTLFSFREAAKKR